MLFVMENNMDNYIPPYTITDKMMELTASISEKVGKISSTGNLDSKPHLRRNNRIRSIHSSLKIEANSLSLNEVRDVIGGQLVLGDEKEIREVKNAYSAYSMIEKVDPYSLNDLKKLHGLMTDQTVAESGVFRSSGEGVFDGDKCIFIAPPPEMVPELMKDLFRWMQQNKTKVHPLILSAVFHYEFVFIHPFADGNGRTARLWHTILLYNWRDVFEYIPLETQIEKHQDAYYSAIAACNKTGNSDIFIEFALEQTDQILGETIDQIHRTNMETSEYVRRMVSCMEYDMPYTANEIMEQLGLKSKESFRKNYMNPAIAQGFVQMTIPDKPNSRNQRYIKK